MPKKATQKRRKTIAKAHRCPKETLGIICHSVSVSYRDWILYERSGCFYYAMHFKGKEGHSLKIQNRRRTN